MNFEKEKSLGKTVKVNRIRSDMSQEDLAMKIGTSKQTISLIENDKILPSFQIVVSIAKSLERDVDIFLEQYLEKVLFADNFNFNDYISLKKKTGGLE